MSKITDFHPLVAPHLDGCREAQWCTFASDHGMLYLLNGDRHALGEIGDDDVNISVDIHFPTEAACHASAAEYYLNHHTTYPYLTEWKASLENVADTDDADTESQVMEFV